MKFCDERIQNHLLKGGKIKRKLQEYYGSGCGYRPVMLKNDVLRFANGMNEKYYIDTLDLTADDWEIIPTEYDWDKIIKDKVLCVLSNDTSFEKFIIAPLTFYNNESNDTYSFACFYSGCYKYCKPFNPVEFNIAKNLKEYEK